MMRITTCAFVTLFLLSQNNFIKVESFTNTSPLTTPCQKIQRHNQQQQRTSHLFAGKSEGDDEQQKEGGFFHQMRSVENVVKSTLAGLALSIAIATSPAQAAESAKIAGCLFQKCQVPLVKCITNPRCLANVICINTCNGKDDEIGCQIKCGDLWENDVVGEFNKCAVSDMSCVPKKMDDGSYPVPDNSKLVQKFSTSLFNGRWYITAGQNELFDIFPCQVHFFTETKPGTFFGKLNWRIQEPDGEFFNRDAVQQFIQDPKQPGHLVNHDNEFLHYEDDWYIIDYAEDNNKEGVPPFAFVYYRGNNDAWEGYGGVVVYTRASKLPPELVPRLQKAAEKVRFNFDRDFTLVDNTCQAQDNEDKTLLREKFAGKVLLQSEQQVQAAGTRFRGNAINSVKAQKLFVDKEFKLTEKAVLELSNKVKEFEQEIVQEVVKQ